MTTSSPLLSRLAIAKMAGLMIGLVGFGLIPAIMPGSDPIARWGVLFWYPTMGTVIALFDVHASAGRLPWRPPWWLIGMTVGAWFNFVVSFLSYDFMHRFLVHVFGPDGVMTSPFWFVLEGAGAGALIAYLVMRFGGDGRGVEDE